MSTRAGSSLPLAQAPTEVRLTRGLSGLSRLSRLTLTASGASHGIPDWVASLPALRALDVRMECRWVLQCTCS